MKSVFLTIFFNCCCGWLTRALDITQLTIEKPRAHNTHNRWGDDACFFPHFLDHHYVSLACGFRVHFGKLNSLRDVEIEFYVDMLYEQFHFGMRSILSWPGLWCSVTVRIIDREYGGLWLCVNALAVPLT